jgi:hypothetical protein
MADFYTKPVYQGTMTGEQITVELMLQELNKIEVRHDESKAMPLITALTKRGIYPAETVPGNSSTVLDMVQGWGAWWFEYKAPFECPHCKTDLRDYKWGPPGKREIGIVVNDFVQHWECPDCHGTWAR